MNESQALAELLQGRRPQLMAFIGRRMSDALRRKVEPADIYQETAAAALAAWPAVDLPGRDPFAWLCHVARNRIVDASRRFAAGKRTACREVSLNEKLAAADLELIEVLMASLTRRRDRLQVFRRRRGELLDVLPANLIGDSQTSSREEQAQWLLAVIEQLPLGQRNVLRWRYIDGLPTKEIAERVGRTDGAIRVLLTRTVDKLQALLRDEIDRS